VRVDLIAVGRLKSGPERDLCTRYAERFRSLGRNMGLDGPRILELSESPARRDEDRKREEATAITAQISAGSALILLTETGRMMTSAAFATMLRDMRDSGVASLTFVIGGADGLGESLTARASQSLAFGGMTIPHQIVRVLVLEQLYRAATILAGHPYHRE
jgi:23S rRNA (pseudouridine1915-N3)-methyltransferase